ncbi:MAG TPA: M20/M25/M40 family metallo-hydrolase [Tepidisphaeraceae bacterium]
MQPSVVGQFERMVRELEAFGHRGSASAQEHRAAEYLVEQLRSIGLEPQREAFAGARSLAERLLAHMIVAAVGAGLLWNVPVAAIVLGVVAFASLIAEQTTRTVLISRPAVRFESSNVWAKIPARQPARRRIVLCAHYDTNHSGWVWTINRYLMPLGFAGPLYLKPPLLPVAGMMFGQIVLGSVVVAFGHSIVLSGLGALLLAGYAVMTVLFVQWAMGRAVPGAADNASGVAAVLELAARWQAAPPAEDVELVVLLPGCEESGMLGAAAWADRHGAEIRALPTTFLNIDGIGFGPPRFLGAEVPAAGLPTRAPQWIVDICRQVALGQNLADAGPHALPGPTDGLAFLARRIPGITIVGFRDGGVLPHYHTMQDTSANVDFEAAAAGVEFTGAVLGKLATV